MFLLLSFISRQTIRVIVKIEGEIILLSELIHPALIIKQRLCLTKRIEFDYKSLHSTESSSLVAKAFIFISAI